MNLIIITCPSLYSDRAPHLLENVQHSRLGRLCSSSHIVSGSDQSVAAQTPCNYTPHEWSDDIETGWEAFLGNIIGVQKNSLGISSSHAKSLVDTCDISSAFPSRFLTDGEKSVFYRHIYACKIASSMKESAIVLEDVAHILNISKC